MNKIQSNQSIINQFNQFNQSNQCNRSNQSNQSNQSINPFNQSTYNYAIKSIKSVSDQSNKFNQSNRSNQFNKFNQSFNLVAWESIDQYSINQSIWFRKLQIIIKNKMSTITWINAKKIKMFSCLRLEPRPLDPQPNALTTRLHRGYR